MKKASVLILPTVIAAGVGLGLVGQENDWLQLAVPATAQEGDTEGGPPPDMMMPTVPVAEVISRLVAPTASFTGRTASAETVELRPQVGGLVESVSVPEGEMVKKGQALFQIDPRPFHIAVESAEAQFNQAQILLDQAETDFERAQSLAPSGAVSRKAFDDAQAIWRERQAQLLAARANLDAAELDLSYASVTAPINGRAGNVLVTEGNLVSAGGAGAATLLTTIVSTDPIRVYFDIDEATYLDFAAHARPDDGARVTAKLPVQVGLMNESGFPHEGSLDYLDNSINPETGTIRARVTIANPDGKLVPGLFARVRLTTGSPHDVILVDDQAIGSDQDMRFVLVLGANDTVEFRPVALGPMVDGLRSVESGLNPGDKVIIKGLVGPGMQVKPAEVPMDQTSGLPKKVASAAGDAAPEVQSHEPGGSAESTEQEEPPGEHPDASVGPRAESAVDGAAGVQTMTQAVESAESN